MRTQEEIICALLAGQLDIDDVKIKERVIVEKIDCSGETKKLVETRVFEDGACIEVIKS